MIKATFHPSLPEYSRRLLETLGVKPIYDDEAPLRCDCEGCHAYRQRNADLRRAREVRALVRAGICPMHRVPQPCGKCQAETVEP